MRFIDLVGPEQKWLASYKDDKVDATYVASLLASETVTDLNSLDKSKLYLFCFYNPLQALLAYFIGSYLGLTCAVVSPRSIGKVLEGLQQDQVGAVLVPIGKKAPELPTGIEVKEFDYKVDLATTIDLDGLFANSHRPARFVFCTSGTTGKAKRVVHCESSLVGNAKKVTEYLQLQHSDKSYCVFPLQYMYGLSTTLCTLHSQSSIAYGDFVSPSLVASYVKQNKITVFPLLGEWSYELTQVWADDYQPQRLILLNASDRLLKAQAQELMPWASKFWNNLGQTESGPRIFAIELTQYQQLDRVCHNNTVAVGEPITEQIEVKLIDKNQATGVGNLHYKTPFKMLGYMLDDGSLTNPNEWTDSGDLFYQDETGLWHWLTRCSHTIKVNGELVPLTSVTNKLMNYQEVTGVGYATNKKGELCTYVESSCNCDVLRTELSSMMAKTLRGKRSRVALVSELPRAENGKLELSAKWQQSIEQVQFS